MFVLLTRSSASFSMGCQPSSQLCSAAWKLAPLPNLVSVNSRRNALTSPHPQAPPCLVHAHKADDSPLELKLIVNFGYHRSSELYFALLGLSYDNMPNVRTKMEYNFTMKIYFFPKFLTLNLEASK